MEKCCKSAKDWFHWLFPTSLLRWWTTLIKAVSYPSQSSAMLHISISSLVDTICIKFIRSIWNNHSYAWDKHTHTRPELQLKPPCKLLLVIPLSLLVIRYFKTIWQLNLPELPSFTILISNRYLRIWLTDKRNKIKIVHHLLHFCCTTGTLAQQRNEQL